MAKVNVELQDYTLTNSTFCLTERSESEYLPSADEEKLSTAIEKKGDDKYRLHPKIVALWKFLKKNPRFVWLLMLKIIIILSVFLIFIIIVKPLLEKAFEYFIEEIALSNGMAIPFYIVIYSTASCFFFPTELLSIAGGFLFKVIYGFPAAPAISLAVCIASLAFNTIICHAMGFLFIRGWLKTYADRTPWVKNAIITAEQHKMELALYLRIAPSFSFCLASYLLSCTTISLKLSLLTCIAALPSISTIYAIIGAYAEPLLQFSPALNKYIVGIFSGYAVLTVVTLTIMMRKFLGYYRLIAYQQMNGEL